MLDKQVKVLLVMNVGGVFYGIDVCHVLQIYSYAVIEPLPRTPDYVLGVINYQSAIVPVINIASKLNMAKLVMPQPVVIVLSVTGKDEQTRKACCIVDEIIGVRTFEASERRTDFAFGSQASEGCFSDYLEYDSDLVLHLDVAKVFDYEN